MSEEKLKPFDLTASEIEAKCSLSSGNIETLKRIQHYLSVDTWEDILKGSIWSALTGKLFKDVFGDINKDLFSDLSNLMESLTQKMEDRLRELEKLQEEVLQSGETTTKQAMDYLKKESERIEDEITWWATASGYVEDTISSVEHCLNAAKKSAKRNTSKSHHMRMQHEMNDELRSIGVEDPFWVGEVTNLEAVDVDSAIYTHFYLGSSEESEATSEDL